MQVRKLSCRNYTQTLAGVIDCDFNTLYVSNFTIRWTHYYDKPGKLARCSPIYGTMLGQCTRNRDNAGLIFLVCRDV